MTIVETSNPKLPKPSSRTFNEYIDAEVLPFLYDNCSREAANQLILLVQYLEHQRYDFSADRAFQTRPICIAQVAKHFRVTKRSAQRWLAKLEHFGILQRDYRKDPNHRFKNKFSRVAFTAFKEWFGRTLETAKQVLRDAVCRPTEKAIYDSNLTSLISKEVKMQNFPESGGVKYSTYWLDLALKHLPGGSKRPCSTMVAERFRENLKNYGIPLSHPSLTARWISFCKRAKPAF